MSDRCRCRRRWCWRAGVLMGLCGRHLLQALAPIPLQKDDHR